MVAPEMFYFTLLTCLIVVTSSDGMLIESSHHALTRDLDNLIPNVTEYLVEGNANSFSTFNRTEAEKINLNTPKASVDRKRTLSKEKNEKAKTIKVDTIFKNVCSNPESNQFDILEEYVDLVTSMNPVTYPEVLKEAGHAYVVDDYNRHLKVAKDHFFSWRYGNVKSDIRRTYESAKAFEPEFQRKYKIFQEKLKMNSNSNHDLKRKENLLKEREYIKDLLLQNDLNENTVSFMKQQLQTKENELNELSVIERDIDEIITFLEFVKENADIIKQIANVTGGKMKIFRDFILKDESSFIQSKTNAEEAIHTSLKQLDSILDQIEEHKKNKETEEKKYQHLTEEITETVADIKDLVKEQKCNRQSYEEKLMNMKSSYLNFELHFLLPSVKFSVYENIEKMKQLTEVMHLEHNWFTETISMFQEREKLNQERLDQTTQRIYNLEDKILKVKTEIKNILYVQYCLETVTQESKRILPYFNKLLENLNSLVDISDKIVFGLESLISKAKEVKDPVEKAKFKDLIYIDISKMQTDWNNAYLDIISAQSYVEADYCKKNQPEE